MSFLISGVPDEDWYSNLSAKQRVANHCPIAANDKCPRYFMSQTNASVMGVVSLNLSEKTALELKKLWEASDVFSSMDSTVGIYPNKHDGTIRGVSGFCPEVTARLFGLFCSDLRAYPDEVSRLEAHVILENAKAPKEDMRWDWMVSEGKHFCQCHEFSVYGPLTTNKKTKPKTRKGSLSPKVRFAVFDRDKFRCVYCGITAKNSELQTDHKIPIALGGSDELSNLVTACVKCNYGKGALPLSIN